MRIKKLELIGFKSFKDRTVIQFDAGITGVVGPNGCGKSNIVDALSWVMGEMSAKQLRGSSMDDVIFAGSDGHAPVGMAEVSMTLENDGGPFPVKYLNHSEIMVTRRLHRSGESGYFINKEPARLRDVQEIFMDTGAGAKGFSIVAQGMIGQIITQKPEERRSLIEEAAGITKFKARKKESQRKLVATEQNLVRLNDIITELKRQIDSLQRQAQRAERYRGLKTQIEDLDLWMSSTEYVEIRNKLQTLEGELAEVSDRDIEGQTKTGELEAQVEELKSEIAAVETLVQSRQGRLAELQGKSRDMDIHIREIRFEIEQAHRNEERTGTLLQELKMRSELQSGEVDEASSRLESIEKEAVAAEQVYLEKSQSFAGIQEEINQIGEQLTEKRREMLTISQSESATDSQVQVLEQQKSEIEEKLSGESEALQELATKRTEFEKRRNKTRDDVEKNRQLHLELAQDVESQEENRRLLVEKVAEKRQEMEHFKSELGHVSSRLDGLEELHQSFEGFQDGVKRVISWHQKQVEMHADGSTSEYFQPVGEVVGVPQDYELAMEAALGARMQVLLTEDSSSSLAAVDYLKESGAGRSSFLSAADAEAIGSTGTPAGEGFLTTLVDQIEVPETFRPAAEKLFSKIAVVDSVRSAMKFRTDHQDWTFVTREGDVLSSDGVLSGGAPESADSGYLKRKREIKELTDKKAEWSGKLALATAALKKLDAQLEHMTQDWEETQKKNLEQEIRLAETRKDLERAENEYENANRIFEQQQQRMSDVQSQLTRLLDRISELNEALVDLRERRVLSDELIAKLDAELEEKQSGVEGRQAEVTELKVAMATLKQSVEEKKRQFEMLTSALNETNSQIGKIEKESEEQAESLSGHQVEVEREKIELEKMLDEISLLEKEVSEHKNKFEEQSQKLRDSEAELHALYRTKNEWQSKINDLQLKIDQEKMRQQYLMDQMAEKYQIVLSDKAEEYAAREGDVSKAKSELADLKQKLGRIGEVNLSAIEEYDETLERYEFLKKQQQDLVAAKEQLNRVIDRINKICTHRFKNTYEMVNERFKKVFPVLFGGGEAELVLVQAEGKEDGIDIVAKPPGKKMQNVTLMSGGEKALTAVSLIFSIFLVKPSPYCLLDEVDAPLDDANVARFNELVNEMAKRSQIILVTHNKYTMEITKKLYGVTMQEKGVSKMVSVSLEDARKVVG